jgi:hypothetical protein
MNSKLIKAALKSSPRWYLQDGILVADAVTFQVCIDIDVEHKGLFELYPYSAPNALKAICTSAEKAKTEPVFSVTDYALTIRGGSATVKIDLEEVKEAYAPSWAKTGFPQIDLTSDPGFITTVGDLIPYASKETARNALMAICFDPINNRAVATNGYTLALRDQPVYGNATKQAVINREGLDFIHQTRTVWGKKGIGTNWAIASDANGKNTLCVATDDRKCVVWCDSIVDVYPDVAHVIPVKQDCHYVKFDKAYWETDLLKRVSFFGKDALLELWITPNDPVVAFHCFHTSFQSPDVKARGLIRAIETDVTEGTYLPFILDSLRSIIKTLPDNATTVTLWFTETGAPYMVESAASPVKFVSIMADYDCNRTSETPKDQPPFPVDDLRSELEIPTEAYIWQTMASKGR